MAIYRKGLKGTPPLFPGVGDGRRKEREKYIEKIRGGYVIKGRWRVSWDV